ncbi:D-Tyr tRNAtyr deacylase-like domain-containing protein [Fomes fomentarius]|nr:D-Tyr tRNAtyr deacylase-like domain-containing protein [Fomes fomentarius]
MRAIVQRVSSASVTVDNEVISSIGRGLMVLVGIGRDDNTTDLESLTKQILSLKVFSDDASGAMWKRNVKDIGGEVLCISQFTLFANTAKGKPDFHRAMATGPSRELYGSFLKQMGELYRPEKIQGAMSSLGRTGVYIPRHATRASHHARADVALGANRRSLWRDDGRPPDERGALAVWTTMHTRSALTDGTRTQGPVTFTLDSRKFEYVDSSASGAASKKGTPIASGTQTPRTQEPSTLTDNAQYAAVEAT